MVEHGPVFHLRKELTMSMMTKTLEKKVTALDARVAELSLDVVTWRQRAMIAESSERSLEKRLLVQTATSLELERKLRYLRGRSVVSLLWDRLRGRK